MAADEVTDFGLSWCQPSQRMANARPVCAASRSESCGGEGAGRGRFEDVHLGTMPTSQCKTKIFVPTMIMLNPASTTPDQSVPNVDLRAVIFSTRIPKNANRPTMIRAAIS